jgi:cytochrome c peroxidase
MAVEYKVLRIRGGFMDRRNGQAPTLTAGEIDDVVAFLCTLTDGYDPKDPAAYDVPAQCASTAVTAAASK